MELTDVMNQMDLTDISRTFQPDTKEYTFFSALHDSYSQNDHILTHTVNLNKH